MRVVTRAALLAAAVALLVSAAPAAADGVPPMPVTIASQGQFAKERIGGDQEIQYWCTATAPGALSTTLHCGSGTVTVPGGGAAWADAFEMPWGPWTLCWSVEAVYPNTTVYRTTTACTEAGVVVDPPTR